MSNDENNEVCLWPEKPELKNIDLSNLILIKNVDDEILIGYNAEGKHNTMISNSSESEKLLVHHHYGTIIQNIQSHPDQPQLLFDPQRVYAIKFEIMLLKYIILILSLILVVIDLKNVKARLDSKKEIIAEVKLAENRC